MSNDFFKFIFNEETKTTMLNLMQFSFIILIPLLLLVNILNVLPEANEKKGFLETIFEIILHLVILIVGIVIITKFALFFKPYSGSPYPEFTLYPVFIGILIIVLSFQTKFSEKLFIVKEKITNKIKSKNTGATGTNSNANAQAYSLTQTPHVSHSSSSHSQTQNTTQVQTLPNYNQMYQNQPVNPENEFVPAAANEGFGVGSNFF